MESLTPIRHSTKNSWRKRLEELLQSSPEDMEEKDNPPDYMEEKDKRPEDMEGKDKRPKVKRWNDKEKDNFLNILKRINPCDDDQWRQVQKTKKDVYRSIEDLKKVAKDLRWKPIVYRKNTSMIEDQTSFTDGVTARGGVARIIQLQEAAGQLARQKKPDFDQQHAESLARTSFNVPSDLDDSFLAAARSPANPKKHRPSYFHSQNIPRQHYSFSNLDETSTSEIDKSASDASVIIQDEKARKREITIGFQTLMQKKKKTQKKNNFCTATSEVTSTCFAIPELLGKRPQKEPLYTELEESLEADEDDSFEEKL